jgi:2-phosphoglycolate phosphatase
VIQAALFDLDGTLIDSSPDFVKCLNTLLIENNRSAIQESDIRYLVSDGSNVLLKNFLKPSSNEELQNFRERFFKLYHEELEHGSNFFEGVEELITFLEEENIPWGIVTNKFKRFAEKIIQNNPLLQKSQVLVTPDDVSVAKPNPEGLIKAANILGLPPDQCIYVGDHLKDLEAGSNAGMQSIGCLFGYSMAENDETKKHTNYFVHDAYELKSLLSQKIILHER